MIDLTDLQKVIDQKTIIDVKDLRVEAGGIVALVGPVDSGLDTLFELLVGKSRPTVGTVRLAGIDPYAQRDRFSRQVGIVFREDNLYKRQSALGNLKFYCRLHRIPASRAAEMLELVGLADHADTRVGELSTSLMRRLAFGRAILHNPKVLLLDEPFGKCDETCISLLSRMIRQRAEAEVAVLILSGDVASLTPLCDTIHRMERGRIVDTFDPHEVHRPDMPFMIPARLEGKVALVDPADIWFIYAQDDRAYLQTAEGSLPTQFTLAELEKRLSRSGFFRAHRGFLVNLQHVKEVIPYTRDSYSLKLKDEARTEIPLSKSAARELRELLGY